MQRGEGIALVNREHRIYFMAVGLLALWVGFWGFFVPAQVDRAIPWLIPPLHARFVGSLYLSAAVFMAGGLFTIHLSQARVLIWVSTIWTGSLLIISLFHLGEFDYTHKPVWFWFGAYVVYPIVGLWFLWRDKDNHDNVSGRTIPPWINGYFLIQGIAVTLLSLLLLFAPEFMVNFWPWKISPLLAQIYSGPFITYGIASLMLSRKQKWIEIRVTALGIFVAAFGTILASFIHRSLLPASNTSTWVWFAGFSLAAIALAVISIRSLREGRA